MSSGNGPPQRTRPRARSGAWSTRDAEAHLRSLELFGMRFGLERMRRLMTALGSPQSAYPAIHVVGTNGKSSTSRMTAAILARHGLRTGTYLSPHLISYAERIQVGGRDLDADEFAAAVERAAWAAEHVNHTLAEDDHVTQFELLTAAALWELARRRVDVAVIEAGLGGRYDATNVIGAPVCVLTNVGLEHTRWLGPTVEDIALEKLAVLPRHATLVVGPDLAPEVLELARSVAAEREAAIAEVPDRGREPVLEGLAEGAPVPAFQRRNFAVARVAAERHLSRLGVELSEEVVAEAGRASAVPGRFEVLRGAPLTILDGAHNPDAARALADSARALLGGRPLGLVLGVLDDKDAVGMLRALMPLCERAWFTAPPGSRALPPATLHSLARQLGYEDTVCEPQPSRALAAAWHWAESVGEARPAGAGQGVVVLATGSIYLIGELLRDQRSASAVTDTASSGARWQSGRRGGAGEQ